MKQSLDTHRLFVDETAERSFLDCMLIPSPSPIHVFIQERNANFYLFKEKKNAHERKANSGVPFCPIPIKRLVRAPLPLRSRASKDSSGLHEQILSPRPTKGHVFFLPSSAPSKSFAAPIVFPGPAPPRSRPIAPRGVARPRPSGSGPPPLFSRLPLSACALPANRVAAADWWPRRSQSEGGTSR